MEFVSCKIIIEKKRLLVSGIRNIIVFGKSVLVTHKHVLSVSSV